MPEEKKYPIGGYAPGNYHNRCTTCERSFFGDKRSFECEPCGTKSQSEWDALTPEQQDERVKKNMEIWKEFQKQQKQKDDEQ